MLFLVLVLMSGKVVFLNCLILIMSVCCCSLFLHERVLFHCEGLWEVLLSDIFLLLF